MVSQSCALSQPTEMKKGRKMKERSFIKAQIISYSSEADSEASVTHEWVCFQVEICPPFLYITLELVLLKAHGALDGALTLHSSPCWCSRVIYKRLQHA